MQSVFFQSVWAQTFLFKVCPTCVSSIALRVSFKWELPKKINSRVLKTTYVSLTINIEGRICVVDTIRTRWAGASKTTRILAKTVGMVLVKATQKSGSNSIVCGKMWLVATRTLQHLWQGNRHTYRWTLCWWRSWCWFQRWWLWVPPCTLEAASASRWLLSDDLPSRSMLVAAAAKQSHQQQQQRTTQPPVSVFPVPCSGALLDPTKPCSARPRHPHQLQVRASSPQPKPQTASSPLSGAEDVENSDAVMRFKGLTSYCYLWTNHFWSTKHRSCNGLCRCWRVQLCPSLEMSFSDGQPAPVRWIRQMSSCKSWELDDAVVIQFQCWQCQYWGGLDPCLANVSNLVRPLVNLPACAPTPPTISHTHISTLITLCG